MFTVVHRSHENRWLVATRDGTSLGWGSVQFIMGTDPCNRCYPNLCGNILFDLFALVRYWFPRLVDGEWQLVAVVLALAIAVVIIVAVASCINHDSRTLYYCW